MFRPRQRCSQAGIRGGEGGEGVRVVLLERGRFKKGRSRGEYGSLRSHKGTLKREGVGGGVSRQTESGLEEPLRRE